MHPKLKRKVSYKHCLKLDGYKLIKFILEERSLNILLKKKIEKRNYKHNMYFIYVYTMN